MKTTIAGLAIALCVYTSCSKSSVPTENGSINGVPALTLYGSSKLPSDYLFLSTAQKEISYNGQVLNYVYGANAIFLIYSGIAVAKATLDTVTAPTALTIDSTYGINFGSRVYTAKQ